MNHTQLSTQLDLTMPDLLEGKLGFHSRQPMLEAGMELGMASRLVMMKKRERVTKE